MGRPRATEVGRRIFERLEDEDPSAIDESVVSGVIDPVNFGTAVEERDLRLGVKVQARHVTANLVLDRPRKRGNTSVGGFNPGATEFV